MGVLAGLGMRVCVSGGGNFLWGVFFFGGCAVAFDCLPIVLLQYLLSLSFRNSMIPLGAGLGLYVAGMVAAHWRYGYVVPYTYPVSEFVAGLPLRVDFHWWASGYAVGFGVVGYILYITKKEVHSAGRQVCMRVTGDILPADPVVRPHGQAFRPHTITLSRTFLRVFGIILPGHLVVPAVLAFYTFYTYCSPGSCKRSGCCCCWCRLPGYVCGRAVIAILCRVRLRTSLFQSGYGGGHPVPVRDRPGQRGLGTGDEGIHHLVSRDPAEGRIKAAECRDGTGADQIPYFNPHFLFNTLNNIDVLIGKDPVRASSYLKKLPDISAFMLWLATKTAQILIARELGYIKVYRTAADIDCEPRRHRLYRGGAAGAMDGRAHAVHPFIENAFKHGPEGEAFDPYPVRAGRRKDRIQL